MTKRKVAICMRGAMGKEGGGFNDPGSLYNSNKYIDYTVCYNSIKRHIVEANSERYTFDFFCQSWNKDLEQPITDLYLPKASSFEDNMIYTNEILSACRSTGCVAQFACISQALSIQKSIELKEAYEQQTNTAYDLVIIYRYDVMLWKDIDLHSYTNFNTTVYSNGVDIGDFHFIMDNSTASMFKHLYRIIHSDNLGAIAHQTFKRIVAEKMNRRVVGDTILPGSCQEVLRKINERSIPDGHLTYEMLNSYK